MVVTRREKSVEAFDGRARGRWEEVEDCWGDCYYRCTVCGTEYYLDAGTPAENGMDYCPCCGAQMDG